MSINNEFVRKQEERIYLDTLALLYPAFPRGKIIASESPDFVVRSGLRQVTGIEITQMTRREFNWLEGRRGHFLPRLTREQLVELIRYKEDKLALYMRKKLSQIWLVIVAKGFSNPAPYNIRNQLESWHIESRFDRVIMIDLRKNQLYMVSENKAGQQG
jgi:hypothetical protein